MESPHNTACKGLSVRGTAVKDTIKSLFNIASMNVIKNKV